MALQNDDLLIVQQASSQELFKLKVSDLPAPAAPAAPGDGGLTIQSYGESKNSTGSFTANQSAGSTVTLPQIRYQDLSGSPTIPVLGNYDNSSLYTFDAAGNFTATNTVTGKNFKEVVYTIPYSSGITLAPSNGESQLINLTGNTAAASTGWESGESLTLQISMTGTFTIDWTPAGVQWVGGSAPDLSDTGLTVIQLWKTGSNLYGTLIGEI